MRVSQQLPSGLIVHQDFRTSIRAAFYDTGYEEFPYGTNDGTLFIVNFRGRPYGLTCKHVLNGIDLSRLLITPTRLGNQGDPFARLKGSACPSSPTDDAEGTDITDVCVLEFHDDVDVAFFRNTAYILGENTYAHSNPGDDLLVYGFLGENSSFRDAEFTVGCAELEFQDMGPLPHTDGDAQQFEGVSRYARARFLNAGMNKLRGLSGSPVFNRTSGKLAGMVHRGGYIRDQDLWNVVYFDITDIVHVLECVVDGKQTTFYRKTRAIPVAGYR